MPKIKKSTKRYLKNKVSKSNSSSGGKQVAAKTSKSKQSKKLVRPAKSKPARPDQITDLQQDDAYNLGISSDSDLSDSFVEQAELSNASVSNLITLGF